MSKHTSNKKLLFSTSIIGIALLILFFIKINYTSSFNVENALPSYDVQNIDNQEAPDKTEKEPVYMAIFKLIVNCNPFRQNKTQ
ncbi:MAG: hypothetical protein ACYDCN_05370 [Bacteroidia bacterium]